MVGAKMIGRITAAYTEIERITRVSHGSGVDDADVIEYYGMSTYYPNRLEDIVDYAR